MKPYGWTSRLCGLPLLWGIVVVSTAGPIQAYALSFEAALEIALREAPVLQMDAAQVEAARQNVIPSGELPDPRLALGLDNVPISGDDQFSLTAEPMTMQRIGFMQEFPSRSKRAARMEAANGRVAQSEAQARVTRALVSRETAVAWIARDTAERQLARIDALEVENRIFEAAVRARIAGGKGVAAEVVAPRQEAAAIEARRDELDARRRQAIAALRRWVGARADAPLSGMAPEWPITRDLLLHAVHQHPEVLVFDSRARVIDAEVAEARADKKPNWALEAAYARRGSQFGDMAMIQISFDLPVFAASRQDPKIAARLAERNGLDAEREAVLREHAAMVETDVAEYERVTRAATRQRDVLLPLATEKVDLATASWRGGNGELVDLVMARRERIDAELTAIALEGERRQIAARLHYAYNHIQGEQE